MEVVIGSGPKGRGFESRHFDQEENPGSVRLPGFFLFPGDCGKAGENVEKLGEGSEKKSREALYNNTSRLGEMGEISTAVLVKRPERIDPDPQRDQPAGHPDQLMRRGAGGPCRPRRPDPGLAWRPHMLEG